MTSQEGCWFVILALNVLITQTQRSHAVKVLTPPRWEITFECLACCVPRIIYRLFHAGQQLLRSLHSAADPADRGCWPGRGHGSPFSPVGKTQMDARQELSL